MGVNMNTKKQKANLVTIAATLALFGIVFKFVTTVWEYTNPVIFSSQYNVMTFLMPIICVLAVVLLLQQKKIPWLTFAAACFVIYAIAVTASNLLYAASELPMVSVNIMYWFAIYYIFYRYASYNDVEWICKVFYILLCICFVLYLISIKNARLIEKFEKNDLLLNTVYYLLFLFPMVLLSKQKWQVFFGAAMVFISVSISNKRTALLAFLLCALFWMLKSLKGKKLSIRVGLLCLFVAVYVSGFYFFNYLIRLFGVNIVDRLEGAMSNGGTWSGRTEIWTSLLDYIKSDNIIFNLVGRGYRSMSKAKMGLSEAHNDFLQILFDYGVFGLVLFVTFIVQLIHRAVQLSRENSKMSLAFSISLVLYMTCAMVSQVMVYPYWFLGIAALWGYHSWGKRKGKSFRKYNSRIGGGKTL